MFSWICPQCGRDVPPSKTDCPFCAEQARETAAIAAAAPPQYPSGPPDSQPAPWQQAPPAYAPAPPQWQPPPLAQQAPPQYAPQPQAPPPPPPPAQYQPAPQYPPQQYAPPQQQFPQQQFAPPHPQHQPPAPAAWPPPAVKSGPPTWLMAAGVAVVLLLIGGGVYYFMNRGGNNPAEKAGLENPANASRQKVSNPLQKYVEVVGLRMINEDKKPVAKFVVVNHSSAEISDLAANVTLWASTSRSEEDSVGSFSFKIPSIGPNDSKDLTEPLKTKFKMYELPDWQNTTAEIEITSPAP